jgi:hypothetical protein
MNPINDYFIANNYHITNIFNKIDYEYLITGVQFSHLRELLQKYGEIPGVRHVTGNDKDYLRKIPRVVW